MRNLAQSDRLTLLTALETARHIIYTHHSDLRLDISIEQTADRVKATVRYSNYLLYNVQTKHLEMAGVGSSCVEGSPHSWHPVQGYRTPGHQIWELLVASSPALADFEFHDGVVIDHVFDDRTHEDFYWNFDLPQD